ncbi:MAG TPA: DUF192 domain-containing protein [Candidatus Paceibacterota bacterium]|nr:DUF192 domain-containing protein [Candidatus Paceibacterota bacterium]HPT17926.1 DUF192 domain-containing protein [Candidatus Paceibacterota bacterium]
MNLKTFFLFIFLFVILIFGFVFLNKYNSLQKIEVKNIKHVQVAGKIIKVNLALNDKDQEIGLSGKKYLKENEGMLFIFSDVSRRYFWMKEMNFPIDIIWLNEKLEVIYIKKNVYPESYPDSFGPDENSKYVLEVNAGFSEKNNLREGNFVKFLP